VKLDAAKTCRAEFDGIEIRLSFRSLGAPDTSIDAPSFPIDGKFFAVAEVSNADPSKTYSFAWRVDNDDNDAILVRNTARSNATADWQEVQLKRSASVFVKVSDGLGEREVSLPVNITPPVQEFGVTADTVDGTTPRGGTVQLIARGTVSGNPILEDVMSLGRTVAQYEWLILYEGAVAAPDDLATVCDDVSPPSMCFRFPDGVEPLESGASPSLNVGGLQAGGWRVIVKVTDSVGNIATSAQGDLRFAL
jgi:hypothetical protein